MTKNILAIYYTQTGQLGQIVDEFCEPMRENHNLEVVHISPKKEYEFPWNGKKFFGVMPDSVLGNTIELDDFHFQRDQYDLIIFGYQPWFLSPSIPATSILNHPKVSRVMANTSVVTVIGGRNMWLNAQQKIKSMIADNSGKLVGNVAFIDRHKNLTSVVSIVYWLIYGKKEKLWGIFPKAGVSESDIRSASLFGQMALPNLNSGDWSGYQDKVVEQGGVEIKRNIMFIEGKAGKIFKLWANFINKRKSKSLWLTIFKYYLFFALFVVSPILLAIYNLLIVPFSTKSLKRKTTYFQGLN